MSEERKKIINELKESVELLNKNKVNEAEKILTRLSNYNELQADTFSYLGVCYIKKNNSKKAAEYLERSLKVNPNHEYSNLNLGLIYFSNKDYDLSLNFIQKTRKINKNNQMAIYHIGLINMALNNYLEAEKDFKELLEINSKDQNALLNLGIIYNKIKDFDKSVSIYNQIIKINPNNIYAYNNLGLTYFDNLDFDKAIKYYEKCIEINKNFLVVYGNLGRAYSEIRKFKKALTNFKKAAEGNSKDYNNLFAIGKTYLSLGEYDKGLKYYEFRKFLNKTDYIEYIKKNFKSKEWNGEKIINKKILILSEQGFGDNIQFSRYLHQLNKNNKVIFLVNKKLNFLFRKSSFKIINNLNEINEHDYFQNLLTLPKIHYENYKSFLTNHNFIKNDKETDLKWNKKFKQIKKFKVGIFWQGNKNYYGDDKRSIPLIKFERIIKNANISIISLQKGFGVDQIEANNFEKYLINLSDEIDNDQDAYKDSISILKNLDLLITSDSSIAHLAGTMNINTWLALCYNPDWRWYIENKTRIFYNTIKIFQQDTPGNWESVFDKINEELNLKLNN